MFSLFIIMVAMLTTVLPLVVGVVANHYPKYKFSLSYGWLPPLAGFLFIAAFFLPDIYISNETSTLQQHFIGGGVYAALLYVYCKKLIGWRSSLLVSLLCLFAWVSAFGVANELLEFGLTKLGLANIGTGDTDWDLLANTLGALTGYVVLLLFKVDTYVHRKLQ